MAKKRSHEKIENIDDVDGPMCSTSIHGAVVRLSPVKKGWKAMFFDSVLEDETSQIRLVGFQGMQQCKLNDYHQKNHCGHTFLRHIDLLNSIVCTTVLHCGHTYLNLS